MFTYTLKFWVIKIYLQLKILDFWVIKTYLQHSLEILGNKIYLQYSLEILDF
jgi:hypothetical protein